MRKSKELGFLLVDLELAWDELRGMKSGKEYREVKHQQGKIDKGARHQIVVGADALAILRKNGVVGCLHDDSDLSEKYKEKLDWSSKL